MGDDAINYKIQFREKIIMAKEEYKIDPFFANPALQVQLDLDLEKLTEFAFQLQNKDKKGVQFTNRGGWQSNDIHEEKHEEFIRLKGKIDQYLQIYYSEIFGGMKFSDQNFSFGPFWHVFEELQPNGPQNQILHQILL